MTYQVPNVPLGRLRLAAVIGQSKDVVAIADAARLLELSELQAAKLLARWAKQGWLRRVGPGLYVSVPIESLASEHVLDDPWVLIPSLFGDAYVGGWSAAEHWDLTEQLFREIVVFTSQAAPKKRVESHGAHFIVSHLKQEKLFGAKPVWRKQTKVAVSDVHRTIVDMLSLPELGGGAQHLSDCLRAYLKRQDRDDAKIIDYATRLGNGAVFKRLGFLIEGVPGTQLLAAACSQHLTAGNAKLDPALPSPRLVTRWRLFVPKSWPRTAG